jgi:sulfur-carrier protein
MARVRLFANLRELAGNDRIELPGDTVADVLDAAGDRFGDEFRRALETSQVWVDGSRAGSADGVADDSDVAILPPVSGGAMVVQNPITFEFALVAAFTFGLMLANFLSLQWLAVVSVLLMALWVYDLAGTGERQGLRLGSAPMYLGVVGGVLATYRFGGPGMAAAVVGAALLALAWGVARADLRAVESIAAMTAVTVVVAFGSAALILIRIRSRDEATVFLVLAMVAILVAWLSDRSEMPIVDPMIAMILGGLVAGLAASALWAPDVSSAVFASIGAVVGLVSGRTLGMLVRAGGYFGSSDLPGTLGYFDGVVTAAGAYWAVLTLLG